MRSCDGVSACEAYSEGPPLGSERQTPDSKTVKLFCCNGRHSNLGLEFNFLFGETYNLQIF